MSSDNNFTDSEKLNFIFKKFLNKSSTSTSTDDDHIDWFEEHTNSFPGLYPSKNLNIQNIPDIPPTPSDLISGRSDASGNLNGIDIPGFPLKYYHYVSLRPTEGTHDLYKRVYDISGIDNENTVYISNIYAYNST